MFRFIYWIYYSSTTTCYNICSTSISIQFIYVILIYSSDNHCRLSIKMLKVCVVIRIKLLFDSFMINYLHDQSKISRLLYLSKILLISFDNRFRVLLCTSQADLLSRTHPIRLSGTVIASSAILPYMYVHSSVSLYTIMISHMYLLDVESSMNVIV